MKARFIGDPKRNGEGPSTIEVFGLSFSKGEWVNIDGNEAALRKLPGNNHFEVDAGKAPAVKPPAAAPPVPPAPPLPVEIPSDWAKAHHTKRIAWARQVSGGEVKTAAVADAILTAHFSPAETIEPSKEADPSAAAKKPDDDDGFSDLDPE